MATRGRPRIGDKTLTSSERKKRWDVRMRNEDGAVSGQPQRTPVVLYLCESARAVLRQERALAKAADLSAVRDSELVEGLLLRHAVDTDRWDRPGLSIEHLRRHFDLKEAAVMAARADLARHVSHPVKRNRRTLLRIADLPRAEPTAGQIAQALKRRNNTDRDALFEKLAEELRPLFAYRLESEELNGKLRRQINSHIERLLASVD